MKWRWEGCSGQKEEGKAIDWGRSSGGGRGEERKVEKRGFLKSQHKWIGSGDHMANLWWGLSSHRKKRSAPNAFFQIFWPLQRHVKLTKLAKSEKNVFLFVYLFLLKSFGSVTQAHWGESIFQISSESGQRILRYTTPKKSWCQHFCQRRVYLVLSALIFTKNRSPLDTPPIRTIKSYLGVLFQKKIIRGGGVPLKI